MNSFFHRSKININNSFIWSELEGVRATREIKDFLSKYYNKKRTNFDSIYLDRPNGIDADSILHDSKIICENEYSKNVRLSEVEYNGCIYENVKIPKNVLLRMSWLIPDNDMEFDDYFLYGVYKTELDIPVLKRRGTIWMSVTPAEQSSIDPYIKKANGKVLTFGLGLGYFPYMCLLKDNVESVTIVEYDKDVIDMFNNYILPQFDTDKRITIIHGDMYDYYNEDFLNSFDYVFVDTWDTNETGLEMLNKLFELNVGSATDIDYWIEFDCYAPIRILSLIYFESIMNHNYTETLSGIKNKVDNMYMKKIHRYFRGIDMEVTSPEELKEILYSNKVYRKILSNII